MSGVDVKLKCTTKGGTPDRISLNPKAMESSICACEGVGCPSSPALESSEKHSPPANQFPATLTVAIAIWGIGRRRGRGEPTWTKMEPRRSGRDPGAGAATRDAAYAGEKFKPEEHPLVLNGSVAAAG